MVFTQSYPPLGEWRRPLGHDWGEWHCPAWGEATAAGLQLGHPHPIESPLIGSHGQSALGTKDVVKQAQRVASQKSRPQRLLVNYICVVIEPFSLCYQPTHSKEQLCHTVPLPKHSVASKIDKGMQCIKCIVYKQSKFVFPTCSYIYIQHRFMISSTDLHI